MWEVLCGTILTQKSDFLIEILIEIIVDLHAVVRNNTEIPVLFTHFLQG